MVGIYLIVTSTISLVDRHRWVQSGSSRAIDTVNVGTTANDGTGDPLRTAFIKINEALYMLDTLGVDDMRAQWFANLRNLIDSLNIHVDVNDTATMLLHYAQLAEVYAAINDSIEARLDSADVAVALEDRNYLMEDLQDAGMAIVAMPVGATSVLTSYTNMTDGRAYYVLFNQKVDTVFTGVGWIQRVQGVYTADNYNGVALYSVSGTTYTKVASSADDGNIWKGTAYTLQTKAFSSPYNAVAGLYVVAFVYNTSAETTAPSLYDWNTISAVSQLLTGGHKLAGYVASQATLPDSETAGDITAGGQCSGVWLY